RSVRARAFVGVDDVGVAGVVDVDSRRARTAVDVGIAGGRGGDGVAAVGFDVVAGLADGVDGNRCTCLEVGVASGAGDIQRAQADCGGQVQCRGGGRADAVECSDVDRLDVGQR